MNKTFYTPQKMNWLGLLILGILLVISLYGVFLPGLSIPLKLLSGILALFMLWLIYLLVKRAIKKTAIVKVTQDEIIFSPGHFREKWFSWDRLMGFSILSSSTGYVEHQAIEFDFTPNKQITISFLNLDDPFGLIKLLRKREVMEFKF